MGICAQHFAPISRTAVCAAVKRAFAARNLNNRAYRTVSERNVRFVRTGCFFAVSLGVARAILRRFRRNILQRNVSGVTTHP